MKHYGATCVKVDLRAKFMALSLQRFIYQPVDYQPIDLPTTHSLSYNLSTKHQMISPQSIISPNEHSTMIYITHSHVVINQHTFFFFGETVMRQTQREERVGPKCRRFIKVIPKFTHKETNLRTPT